MVFVQDQQAVERSHQHRVDLIELGKVAEVELEEVLNKPERVVWVEHRLAERLLVRVGGNHRHLCEQADRVELDLLGVFRVEVVFVVRREGRDRRREHRHGVRVRRQRGEEALEVFVQQRVAANLLVELAELVGGRQFAVDQEPGSLEIRRVRREVFDRVAAVAKDAGVTINVGDRAARRGRVHKALIERREAGLLHEGRDVD